MKKMRKGGQFGLLRLFIAVLFSSGLINSAITSVAVFLLIRGGFLTVTQAQIPGAGRLLIFFLTLSIPVSLIVAAFSGQFALKPVRDLIDSMNRLASGDFKTRVNVGRFMRRYPAFVEMANSFNRMAQELDNTEMLRSDFINNFSHEFKTPIVSIAGFAQLLQKVELPKAQQQEYLAIIEEECKRLSDMATNVLNLTKVENQSILTDVAEYNLSEQIRSCILLLENKWSKKELELLPEFGEHTIQADPELMKQVWINLLDNAVKFTPDGGTIQISIREAENHLEVTIRNTGSEIPPESMEKIFQKFYQADESHSAQGNGVGLAIVRQVVKLHGGTVRANSGNMETTFTVTLPKCP